MNSPATGFKVTKEVYNNHPLLIFTFGASFSDKEFAEFLGILDKFLDIKKKFSFMVDSSNTKTIPVKASFALVSWMKARKLDIPDILLGSCIVFKSKYVAELVNKAFSIQKPVSPNIITDDFEKGKEFLMKLH